MPFYTFKCPKCKKEKDVLQKMSDKSPTCDGIEMKRIKVHQIGKGNFGNKISEVIKDNVQFVSSTDADWIIISTPNDLHYEQVKYWLTQKKNVFCEKPLTLTYETSEELFNLADKNNVRLYVDDVFSWHDNIQRLTKWIGCHVFYFFRCC